MKTPEQQAQEYADKFIPKFADDKYHKPVEVAYIAGHAAGKQDERERLWSTIQDARTRMGVKFQASMDCKIMLSDLKQILFGQADTGGEKVETQTRYEGGVFNPTTGCYDMKPLNVTKDEGGEG